MLKIDGVGLINALTGLIGATGGLVISYLTLKHVYRKDRHLVRVDIKKGLLLTPQANTTKPKVSKQMLTIKVVNVGAKDFKVVAIGIAFGKRSDGVFINQPTGTVQLPYTLKPDETCSFWTEYDDLVKDIKKPKLYGQIKIRAYAADYIGNAFYSNKLPVVLKETRLYKFRGQVKKVRHSILKFFRP